MGRVPLYRRTYLWESFNVIVQALSVLFRYLPGRGQNPIFVGCKGSVVGSRLHSIYERDDILALVSAGICTSRLRLQATSLCTLLELACWKHVTYPITFFAQARRTPGKSLHLCRAVGPTQDRSKKKGKGRDDNC